MLLIAPRRMTSHFTRQSFSNFEPPSHLLRAEATIVQDDGDVVLAGCDRSFIASPATLQYAASLYSGGLIEPIPDEVQGFHRRRLSQTNDCKNTYVNISTPESFEPFAKLTIVQLAQYSKRAAVRFGPWEGSQWRTSASSDAFYVVSKI